MSETSSLSLEKALAGDSETLSRLFISNFIQSQHKQGDARALSSQQVMDRLCDTPARSDASLVDQLRQQLDAPEKLSDCDYATLVLVDKLFSLYCRQSGLHAQIQALLMQLRPAVANALLQKNNWLFDLQHPLHRTLELLRIHCIGWQPELGKAAERFLDRLTALVQPLQQAQSFSALVSATEPIQAFLDHQQQQSEKLDQRHCDREAGLLRSKHNQQRIARHLNLVMGGKQLPASVSTFMQTHWRNSLLLLLNARGENSAQWREASALSELLVWSVQPHDQADKTLQQKLFEQIPTLTKRLRENTLSLQHQPDQLEKQLSLIAGEHLRVLKSEALQYTPFALIENPGSLADNTLVSASLLKQIEALQSGQWFVQQQDDGERRLRLIAKLDDAQQLLFSNMLGIKAANYGFEEFAYQLSSRICRPLLPPDLLERTAIQLVEKLHERHLQKQQQHSAQREQQQALAEQQARAREQAREKALQEAERLAQQQTAQQALERDIATAQQQEQSRREALEQRDAQLLLAQVEQLQTGAWVSFYDSTGKQTACKLAIRLKSTGKYIFVNRNGLKHCELLQTQLLALLQQGSAEILHRGQQFEDSLVKVVNSLRNKRRGD